MEFKIETKEVEIAGQMYKIRPLTGRFLPKLYSLLGKIEGVENVENTGDMLKFLDEDVVAQLHLLSSESLKKSYPDTDEIVLDEFVSQNLLKFLEVLITVNLNVETEKVKEV